MTNNPLGYYIDALETKLIFWKQGDCSDGLMNTLLLLFSTELCIFLRRGEFVQGKYIPQFMGKIVVCSTDIMLLSHMIMV